MRVPLWIALLGSTGCATGFDRVALRQELADEPLEVTDAEIQRVLALKPQLSVPFRLVVYLSPYHWGGTSREWSADDRNTIRAALGELEREGLVSESFLISEAALGRRGRDADWGTANERLRIRLAAARHHADAVLIVKGAGAVDSYANLLSVLYLTVVGIWFVPGNQNDALFLLRGVLWDVRNEYLYFSAEQAGEGSTMAPKKFDRPQTAIDEARTTAVEAFVKELGERARRLKGTSS